MPNNSNKYNFTQLYLVLLKLIIQIEVYTPGELLPSCERLNGPEIYQICAENYPQYLVDRYEVRRVEANAPNRIFQLAENQYLLSRSRGTPLFE